VSICVKFLPFHRNHILVSRPDLDGSVKEPAVGHSCLLESFRSERPVFAFRSILLVLLLTLSASVAAAQEPKEKPVGPTKPAPKETPFESKSKPKILGDIIYLKRADGQLVPVPADATLEEFLRWRNENAKPTAQPDEAFGIASVSLEGTADDEYATLKAVIRIQVRREEGWVVVPLRLNEAVLKDTAHTFRPNGLPDAKKADADKTNDEAATVGKAEFVHPFDPQDGYRWRFSGVGDHELTLSLIVPIRKQVPSRRLQLALPPSAVHRLVMTLPEERVLVKVLKPAVVQTESLRAKGTKITVTGSSNGRFDLQWQEIPDEKAVDTTLSVRTVMTVESTGDSILLRANQTIQTLQGSFSTIQVRLPDGFELLDVEGKEYANHTVDAKKTTATIELMEATTGPVELRWTLKSAFPKDGQLVLQGFDIEKAQRHQTGEVAIRAIDGYRVNQRIAQDIHRINVSESTEQGTLVGAFRFLKQSFRLVLDLQEVEPFFSVRPELRLNLSSREATLEARYRVQVYRGALQELLLEWPNWKKDGWSVEPVVAAEDDSPFVIDETAPADQLRLLLLDKPGTSFEVRLRAHRDVVSDNTPFDLVLPRIDASTRLPDDVLVELADNIEVDFTPGMDTAFKTVEPLHRDKELRRVRYRIESTARTLSTQISVHERKVAASVLIETEPVRDGLSVTERIRYDVSYAPLSQLKLQIPKSLEEQVEFFIGEERLSVEVSPGETKEWLNATLSLPTSTIDRFELSARYFVEFTAPADASDEFTLLVPFVLPLDTASSHPIDFEYHDGGVFHVTIDGNEWKRRPTTSDGPAFTTKAEVTQIPVRLKRSTQRVAKGYSVDESVIRTLFTPDGTARSRARFLVTGPVSDLAVKIPLRCTIERVWWDTALLEEKEILQVDRQTGEYRLHVSEIGAVGSHQLTIDYRVQSSKPLGWSPRFSVEAPTFPDAAWVERSEWSVSLPSQQYLFTIPDGFAAQFHWVRDGVFWFRRTTPDANNPSATNQTARTAPAGPAPRNEFNSGNVYRFTRFGAATEIGFRSMHQQLVVLFGAGLSLALGFVLLKIPVTRNVLTVLILGFVVSLAALWFLEPIQLLLQPAILGLLLAIAAALIDAFFRRRRSSTILTLSSPSDFVLAPTSTSSVESPPSYEQHPSTMSGALSQPQPHLQPTDALREPVSSHSGFQP